MAHAPILQDRTARRAAKAATIIARQECIPVDDIPGFFQVRDSVSGSGEWHLASISSCDCRDALRNTCKHQMAARQAEADLAAYCDDWNTRSDEQREAVAVVTLSDTSPCCPECGAELETRSYYIGGRGYCYFEVCTRDLAHRALQA